MKISRETVGGENTKVDREKLIRLLWQLNKECGFSGELGSEAFFSVLDEAVHKVAERWDAVIGASHEEGLAFDVNLLLAEAIVEVLKEHEFTFERHIPAGEPDTIY